MKRIISLVGMKYAGTLRIVSAMPSGTGLMVRREPENHHDQLALAVYELSGSKQKLGFLKAGSDQQDLARLMDKMRLSKVEAKLNRMQDGWPQVEIDL